MSKLKEEVTLDDNLAPLSDWIYIPQFLSQQEADGLYALLERLPMINENTGKDALHFGKSYSLNGGPGARTPHESCLSTLRR